MKIKNTETKDQKIKIDKKYKLFLKTWKIRNWDEVSASIAKKKKIVKMKRKNKRTNKKNNIQRKKSYNQIPR